MITRCSEYSVKIEVVNAKKDIIEAIEKQTSVLPMAGQNDSINAIKYLNRDERK